MHPTPPPTGVPWRGSAKNSTPSGLPSQGPTYRSITRSSCTRRRWPHETRCPDLWSRDRKREHIPIVLVAAKGCPAPNRKAKAELICPRQGLARGLLNLHQTAMGTPFQSVTARPSCHRRRAVNPHCLQRHFLKLPFPGEASSACLVRPPTASILAEHSLWRIPVEGKPGGSIVCPLKQNRNKQLAAADSEDTVGLVDNADVVAGLGPV